MLDAFAYPVSALMLLWHHLLSLLSPSDSGVTWVATIVLLVCSVRLLLLRPGWNQLVAARRTALLKPQLQALKRRHGADQQAYVQAVRELHRSEGVGLASGVLPLLLQLPAILGLYHLLIDFTRPGAGSNGLFGVDQVHSFASATMFGVPLSAAVRTSADVLAALRPGLTGVDVLWVLLPFLVVAAAATFVNGWRSLSRQPAPGPDEGPLADSLRRTGRAMVWLGPIALLVGGIAFPLPLALAIYWAVNGTWTTVQTQLMTSRLDRRWPLPG
jgi:YidC/Oxa1 family membrane protein insertase